MSEIDRFVCSPLSRLLKVMKSGGTPDTSRSDFYGGSIPFVAIDDMTSSHKYIEKTRKYLSRDGLVGSNAWLVPPNAILYSIYATLGVPRLNKIPVATNQAILAMLCDEEKVDLDYLYYWLTYIRPSVINFSSQTTQSNLSSTIVKSFEVQHPESLPEQSKIAEILSTVDRAIEQTEALIKKQQRIKTGLMADLLTRGIDADGNLRSEATHAFKDSPLGRIPVEWEVKTVDELTSRVGSGVTPTGGDAVYSKEGVLFIRSQNVYCDGLHLDDVAYISEQIHDSMKRSEVFENDILLNITGASIGRCCRMPARKGKSNVNQHVCAIRLVDTSEPKADFLTSVIESPIGQNQIAQFNAGGNREGLNFKQIRSFNIPWPCADNEFERINTIITKLAKQDKQSRDSLIKLRSLKTALMQDLLTGKKRVTDLLKD